MLTTTQQSISPIHPTLTNPRNKNAASPQTTIQYMVKPSVIPKYEQMDFQTFKPVTTSRQTNKQRRQIEITSHIITIILVQNSQNQLQLQNQNYHNKLLNQYFAMITHELH